VAQVLRELGQDRKAARLAPGFARAQDAADAADRGGARLVGRHAAGEVVVDRELEMRLQLLVEPIVEPPRSRERPEPHEKDAKRGHDRSSSGFTKRAMMSDACDQFSVSFSSWRRPARLIA